MNPKEVLARLRAAKNALAEKDTKRPSTNSQGNVMPTQAIPPSRQTVENLLSSLNVPSPPEPPRPRPRRFRDGSTPEARRAFLALVDAKAPEQAFKDAFRDRGAFDGIHFGREHGEAPTRPYSPEGHTALTIALALGCPGAVAYLLSHATPWLLGEADKTFGRTPLVWASYAANKAMPDSVLCALLPPPGNPEFMHRLCIVRLCIVDGRNFVKYVREAMCEGRISSATHPRFVACLTRALAESLLPTLPRPSTHAPGLPTPTTGNSPDALVGRGDFANAASMLRVLKNRGVAHPEVRGPGPFSVSLALMGAARYRTPSAKDMRTLLEAEVAATAHALPADADGWTLVHLYLHVLNRAHIDRRVPDLLAPAFGRVHGPLARAFLRLAVRNESPPRVYSPDEPRRPAWPQARAPVVYDPVNVRR